MHSFLTTFRFGLEADFHVGLRNNRRWGAGARKCVTRVTHPSRYTRTGNPWLRGKS